MGKALFRGAATALITPFRGGEVDVPALDALVERQLDAGIRALFPVGTTGEPATLSVEEWELVIRRTVAVCGGRVPVIAGTGGNNTRDVLERAARAKALGADAQLCVTPYYNKTTQQGLLAHYRFRGQAALWKLGDAVSPYAALYNRFAEGYNLAIRRSDEMMLNRMKGEYYKDRKFCYLLSEGGRPVAYVIFQDVRHDPAAILSVRDAAWDGPAGFNAILGFLARFSADYGSVELFLPRNLELYAFIRAADAYDIRKTTSQDYMARVVNAKALLALMKKPAGSRFVIKVSDGIIAENNGAFDVRGEDVRETDAAPDLDVSVQALAQLALGAVSLDEGAYREDVRILDNEAALREIFVRKPILVEDHF